MSQPGGSRQQQALRYLRLAAASLAPRRRGSPPPARPLTYGEAELLRRNEEFNRAAEQQWQTIASEPSGREHVVNKPFSTVRDTAAIFYRLSLVLDALDLGVGHTVLDFGAGSCWLSAFLNRLRCHTVSVDVSPTALALGREAFFLDPRQSRDLDARFVSYDGQTLPLEAESVDRAVCFDSFHHVPNQDAVLVEMFRVLRPGGRVVLAEPGEGHAAAEHSQFETSHYGVLENDLDLADLFARARRAGFDRFLTKPYPDAPAITLDGDDYLRLMNGDHSVFPMHLLEQSLRSFYLVALLKGSPRADSRNPRQLLARIEPAPGARLAGKAGEVVPLPLRVENSGDTLWLGALNKAGGYVSLGGHLLDEQLRPVKRCFFADALPRDVAPGDAVEFEATVPPARPARTLRPASRPVRREGGLVRAVRLAHRRRRACSVEGWPDSRAPHRLGVRLELLEPTSAVRLARGTAVTMRLRATNTGDTRWLTGSPAERGAVCLGVQLLDGAGAVLRRDHYRVPLPRPVDPGETVEIEAEVPGPPESGLFRLGFDLVDEQICWFEHHGSAGLALDLETT